MPGVLSQIRVTELLRSAEEVAQLRGTCEELRNRCEVFQSSEDHTKQLEASAPQFSHSVRLPYEQAKSYSRPRSQQLSCICQLHTSGIWCELVSQCVAHHICMCSGGNAAGAEQLPPCDDGAAAGRQQRAGDQAQLAGRPHQLAGGPSC